MIERDKKEIYAEYERRHTFWSEKSLSQLGYSLNLLFTINLAFLAYLITERKNYPSFYFDIHSKPELKLVFYFVLLLIVFISLIAGASATISRLYDLRITRSVVWVRKRTYKKYEVLLSDKYFDFSKENLLLIFLETVFCKIEFITDKDFDNLDILKPKFDRLRLQGKLLGQFTWETHKIHMAFILIASLIYSIATIFGW